MRDAMRTKNIKTIHMKTTRTKTMGDEVGNLSIDTTIGNQIILSDNLPIIRALNDEITQLIYIDPPFNTGKRQQRQRIKTTRDCDGDRIGYQGKRYRTTKLSASGYDDCFDDFQAFLHPRLVEAYRILSDTGSFFLHIDYREAHYCKIALDKVFGRACFMNEIIWAYDYGARSKKKWSAKHDSILWYVKDPKCYTFNYAEIDRIPYMAPKLVGPVKAARGKTPTDVWWHTIVATNGKEKTNYATQKPLGVLERIVKVHSNRGDLLVDFFAGSGSFGAAAANNDRRFLLVDNHPEAARVMKKRLCAFAPKFRDGHAS